MPEGVAQLASTHLGELSGLSTSCFPYNHTAAAPLQLPDQPLPGREYGEGTPSSPNIFHKLTNIVYTYTNTWTRLCELRELEMGRALAARATHRAARAPVVGAWPSA